MKPMNPNVFGDKLPNHIPIKIIKSFDDLIDALTVYGVVYVKTFKMVQNKHWFFRNAKIGWVDEMLKAGNIIKIKPKEPL
jgi:hypothetical protein